MTDNTEDALIIIACSGRLEVDNNTLARVRFNRAHALRERKHVVRIGYKLALCWQVTVIANVKNTIGLSVKLHFAKVERFRAQLHFKAFSLSAAWEIQFVASFRLNAVITAWNDFRNSRGVSYNDSAGGSRGQITIKVAQLDWIVFAVIAYSLNLETGRHLRWVDDNYFLGLRLADERSLEIDWRLINCDEGIFSDCRHFERFCNFNWWVCSVC